MTTNHLDYLYEGFQIGPRKLHSDDKSIVMPVAEGETAEFYAIYHKSYKDVRWHHLADASDEDSARVLCRTMRGMLRQLNQLHDAAMNCDGYGTDEASDKHDNEMNQLHWSLNMTDFYQNVTA